MCPPDEIYQRSEVEVGAKNNFEVRQDGKGFEDLAVKRFARSAAGLKEAEAKAVRPPLILYYTLSYLRDCIIDQDRIPRGKSYYKYQDSSDYLHDFE